MTTKPPSRIKQTPEKGLEAIAYASVQGIPTVEPHDRDRLGYNVWRWLATKNDTLELAVRSAAANLLVSEEQALHHIRESLRSQGITL